MSRAKKSQIRESRVSLGVKSNFKPIRKSRISYAINSKTRSHLANKIGSSYNRHLDSSKNGKQSLLPPETNY